MSATEHPHQRTIDRLRASAQIIERNPKLSFIVGGTAGDKLLVYAFDRSELSRAARQLGGRWEKKVDESYFHLVQTIDDVQVQVYTLREAACEAKVVGTEPVTEQVVTDPARAAELRAELEALTEEVVVGEREVLEWECGPLLASVEQAA